MDPARDQAEAVAFTDGVMQFVGSNEDVSAYIGANTRSIEVGKMADLVVIDKDLYELHPLEISQAKVVLTILGGKTVYEAN